MFRLKIQITLLLFFICRITTSCNQDMIINQTDNLINIIAESPGKNCEKGGNKIETGFDLNQNKILDPAEIINTQYICNGIDGLNQIIEVLEEPILENCKFGGSRVLIGYDSNLNKTLEPSEITNTKYICNGEDGKDGKDGKDALSNIFEIKKINSGSNCEFGGSEIKQGYDLNNDNILDSSEVINTHFICNGSNGLNKLVKINEIESDLNCDSKGAKIDLGYDLNNNNILDSSEVNKTEYLCFKENNDIIFNDLITKYDIEMIGTYGQSLALGSNAASNLNDFQNTPTFNLGSNVSIYDFENDDDKNNFLGTEFRRLNDHNYERFPPATATLTSVLSLIKKENNINNLQDYGYQLFPFTGGRAGSPIHLINKGTSAYNNYLECIDKANEFANNQGKTFAVRVINWIQGESNRFSTKDNYKNSLNQLFNNFNSDIKSITGQTEDVKFITYQVSPWLGRGDLTNMDISEAHVEIAVENPNVYNCGAMYQFKYSDLYHPEDNAVVGLQQGVAFKRLILDETEWITFRPVSHKVIKSSNNNYFIRLKFDVPVKPMRFDTSADDWHNPNGKQPNFGFEVLNSDGNELQVSEPYIVQGNMVVLSTGNVNPKNSIIRYAVNGHDGGGNLCDNQNITVKNKGVDYVIDNFAVAFSQYLID